MEKWIGDHSILSRFFDEAEIAAVEKRGAGRVRSLAARFAAKEAFGKALGTGLAGLALKDIMVVNAVHEKPELLLRGAALALLGKRGITRVHLSLTHEGDTAIAMVVLEE
jgi:holo-[acyl-carrier protein] synthase